MEYNPPFMLLINDYLFFLELVFLVFLGLSLPYEPLTILPLFVLISPFPIIKLN